MTHKTAVTKIEPTNTFTQQGANRDFLLGIVRWDWLWSRFREPRLHGLQVLTPGPVLCRLMGPLDVRGNHVVVGWNYEKSKVVVVLVVQMLVERQWPVIRTSAQDDSG